ncbi:MAG: superoxide dismutase [Oligoflexales bacterium]
MTFKLPELPYAMDALSPTISKETIEYHYGKHHKAYVDKLNALIETEAPQYKNKSLEDIIKTSSGPVFNNAAQIWNHTFYWNCLSPKGKPVADGKIATEITKSFGSFDKFKDEFSTKSKTLFGSGWVWLVKDSSGKLSIEQSKDAENPMTKGKKPLLTCDVWEHAYYIDYRNNRPNYVDAFWNIVNWGFVNEQL